MRHVITEWEKGLPEVALDSTKGEESVIVDGVSLRGSAADCRKAFDVLNELKTRLWELEVWADECERLDARKPRRP